jgi:hypothetical protein
VNPDRKTNQIWASREPKPHPDAPYPALGRGLPESARYEQARIYRFRSDSHVPDTSSVVVERIPFEVWYYLMVPTPSRSAVLMIALAVTVSSKPVESASESASRRDWWRTQGAAVVEHTYGTDETACSAFFYNDHYATVITWRKANRKEISFYGSGWRFQAPDPIPVAVRIGNVWLGGPANRHPPHLTAFANQDRLSVPVNEPLERLLRNATHITVQLADREKSIDLDRYRMSKLLKAVDRCRRAALR